MKVLLLGVGIGLGLGAVAVATAPAWLPGTTGYAVQAAGVKALGAIIAAA